MPCLAKLCSWKVGKSTLKIFFNYDYVLHKDIYWFKLNIDQIISLWDMWNKKSMFSWNSGKNEVTELFLPYKWALHNDKEISLK